MLAVLAIFFDMEEGGSDVNTFIESLNLQNLHNIPPPTLVTPKPVTFAAAIGPSRALP
jgi:hypothetical protein